MVDRDNIGPYGGISSQFSGGLGERGSWGPLWYLEYGQVLMPANAESKISRLIFEP